VGDPLAEGIIKNTSGGSRHPRIKIGADARPLNWVEGKKKSLKFERKQKEPGGLFLGGPPQGKRERTFMHKKNKNNGRRKSPGRIGVERIGRNTNTVKKGSAVHGGFCGLKPIKVLGGDRTKEILNALKVEGD